MLVKGKEIILTFEIFESLDKIKGYTRRIPKDYSNIDDKTIDAIAYRLDKINICSKGISEEFKQEFSEIDWTLLDLTVGFTNIAFEEEFFFDELLDNDTGILNISHKFDAFVKSIFNYLRSFEFLNYSMNISDFHMWFYSKDFIGKACFFNLLFAMGKKDAIEYDDYVENQHKFGLIEFAKFWNEFTNENLQLALKNLEPQKNDKYTISTFFISMIYKIANSSNDLELKKLANEIYDMSLLKNYNFRNIAGEKDLPWCNDYKDSIKSSNSLWTVRKK